MLSEIGPSAIGDKASSATPTRIRVSDAPSSASTSATSTSVATPQRAISVLKSAL